MSACTTLRCRLAPGRRDRGPRASTLPRLLDEVRAAIDLRHYSPRTRTAYAARVRRFVIFNGRRHPRELGPGDVRRFLSALATHGRVGASTQNQALAALLFLYREVLHAPLEGQLDGIVAAKRPARLPVVLTRDEVHRVLAGLDGTPRLVALLLYGGGLRLLEALRLRVKDVDFSTGELLIRGGKGDKDRVTVLPTASTHNGRCRRALSVARGARSVRMGHGTGGVGTWRAPRDGVPTAGAAAAAGRRTTRERRGARGRG